jgi:hypothetical protein
LLFDKTRERMVGAKTSMLAIVDGAGDGNAVAILKSRPRLDRDACLATLRRLFPDQNYDALSDGDLMDAYPRRGELCIACFPGLVLLAHDSLATSASDLDPRFLAFAGTRTMLHHVMISTVDAFAYGVWEQGRLCRSLAIDADNGVTEDIGMRRAFEEPFWSGQHGDEDLDEDYAGGIGFHPLEMAEAALLDLFGYQLEGFSGADEVQPETIPMMRFAPVKPWWKRW